MKSLGIYDRTIIVFTSDHGEQFGEHGQTGHGGFGKGINFFDPLIRVPLIVAGPGIMKGVRVDTPVSTVDLMPTLAGLLGVQPPQEWQGASLAGFLRADRPSPAPRPVFVFSVQRETQGAAVVSEGHKMICDKNWDCALYDLKNDPEEARDIAGEAPLLSTRLRALLQKQRKANARMRRHLASETHGAAPTTDDAEKILPVLKELGYAR